MSEFNPLAAPSMTVAGALRARAQDSAARVFLRYEDRCWTFAEALRESCRYANLLLRLRDGARPFHVGVLMDNLPEFLFAQFGCALANAPLVGLNPTRTGAPLARDVTFADCQIVITEPRYAGALREALAAEPEAKVTVLVADCAPGEAGSLAGALRDVPDTDPQVAVEPADLHLIVFTSGTTKAPKGVLNSHGRLMMLGWGAAMRMSGFTPEDVVYCAMPLYHANAQILAVASALSAAGSIALARRFSKSSFLRDIRRYGATLFNYVGSPLAFIMDTPEKPDDADNPLRLAFGNEAPRQFIEAFGKRFGCQVIDGYGSSEVGVGFQREPGDPPRSLGRAPGVKIINEKGEECPRAKFDAEGRLLNPDECVGEMVNTAGALFFEGYYKDDESTRERTRNGWFYTGDLAYMDDNDYIYFAGRDAEWARVGGENFLVRPIEEILARHPDVMLASVYGVPDPEAGDQLMTTIQLRTDARFDPQDFTAFIDGQKDLPPRWRPMFVRITRELQTTHTNKVLKRLLRREKFLIDRIGDPVYWRPRGAAEYRPFTAADLAGLRDRFERAGYGDRLEE